jgi:hypothetical protein
MKYNQLNNILSIFGRGPHWAESIPWGLFTTPGKFLSHYQFRPFLTSNTDDPASELVHSEAVLTELGSPESFSLAHNWLAECLTSHHECPAHKPVDLPTRLLHVSNLGEPDSARLCSTLGQTGNYCTLSYCWGGPQPFATTIDRYNTYLEDLP